MHVNTGVKTYVQSIIFDRKIYTLSNARGWLKLHGYEPIKQPHTTEHYHRYRIRKPDKNDNYITKDLRNGIKLIILQH